MIYLLALALVCLLVLVVGYGQQRYVQDDLIDRLIKPPVQAFRGADEALQARTQAKRQAANHIRRRAAHVESGSPVAEVLRLMKRS